MYQDSGGVEDGEYHIMYGPYQSLKLGPDPASPTIKLAAVVQDEQGTMTATGALGTVTLSSGGDMVSSTLVDRALAVSSVTLTSTSLSGQIRDNQTPGSSIMAISTVPEEARIGDTDLNSDPLVVATLGSEQDRTPQVDMGQIVSTSGQTVLDRGQLVTSSSIDAAVVTSVFASDCAGMSVGGGGRKLPQQVIVKLLEDDSLGLDMVRIIADQDVDSGPHGFNLLTRNGTIVQKLSEGTIINDVGEDQYHPGDVLRPEEGGKVAEGEVTNQCNVVWTCAYCNLHFTSSEEVGCHQEKNCIENPGLRTSTSQATVDALMSPLRPPDDPSYELKLEETRTSITTEDPSTQKDNSEEEEEEVLVIMWACAVCGLEFPKSNILSDHHHTHTVLELSSALLKLVTPRQIVRKKWKVRSTNTETLAEFPADSLQILSAEDRQLEWNQECSEVKLAKIEEIMIVENTGETPPNTPPQDKLSRKNKRKPGPKARPREKIEKRKYVRKVGEDGHPLRQREHCVPMAGQGSRDPHTCQICNKVLSSRGNLAKHMVLHKPKKPFMCNLCGIGFNAKRDKQHHYLQHHTSERPNICHICGKGYVDSNYLHEHMVFHKQERPFSCDMCGKVFRTARCVARHKQRHGKDRNFTCIICFRSFAIKADLASHVRKVHRSAKRPHLGRQQQQQQEGAIQPSEAKTKDLSEFILPGRPTSNIISEEQLLARELEAGGHKDNIFLADSLSVPAIIPITAAGGGTCPYGIALATPPATQGSGGAGDTQATYIMIEGADGGEVATSHTLPSTPGLIMYTPAPQTSHQMGGELEGSREQLVGVEGELQPPPLHHHHHNHHTQLQDAGGLMDGQRSGLALDTTPAGPIAEICGGEEHDPTQQHSTHLDPAQHHPTHLDPSQHHPTHLDPAQHHPTHLDPDPHDPTPTFPLELFSQTIQLELQRSQSSSTSYLA